MGEEEAQYFQLNNGRKIPALGLGTWQAEPGAVKAAVIHAIHVGYRHIDCAFAYGNEREVGEALEEVFAAGTVQRADLFITTKLWCTYHTRVDEGFRKSLQNLGVGYIDMFLMHWPVAMNAAGNHDLFPTLSDGSRDIDVDQNHVQTWKSMEDLYECNPDMLKGIGVANYSKIYLEELLRHARFLPAINQIENHPRLPQADIVDYCKTHSIHITAYSPLGSAKGPLLSDPVVMAIAKRRNIASSSVLLSYHASRGSSVLAKSTNMARIELNRSLFMLDEEELAHLAVQGQRPQRFVYPSFGIDFGFPDKSQGEQQS